MAATTQQYHFGVSLPQISRTWEETCRAAETFDRLGYDSVWLNDHLYGVPRPDIPILEAWTTLSAVGAITKSVQLGTVVSPPGFRNPALMAKIVATLDQITNGRVILGMGAGWFAQEFRGYGFDFPETKVRLQQLAEAAEIARRAWTEPGLTYQGKHFRTENLILAPGPVRQPHPPILIGGSGEKVTLRIAPASPISGTTRRARRAAWRRRSRRSRSTASRSAGTSTRSQSHSRHWCSSRAAKKTC